MLDLCSLVVDQDAHDVEAQAFELGFPVGEVQLGHGSHGGLLAGGHGVQRVTPAGPAAQLHLGKDEDAVVVEDQIELAPAGAVIAFDKIEAAPGEVPERDLLAKPPGVLSFQTPTPA